MNNDLRQTQNKDKEHSRIIEAKKNEKQPSNSNLNGVKMKNNLGEQNCFVNVVIHLLYNCKEFLEKLKKFHTKSKLLSELKVIKIETGYF